MKFDSNGLSRISGGIRQAAVFAVVLLAVSCGRTSLERNTISLDREVVIPDIGGVVAMTKLAGGELVVTGGSGTTWVTGTSSDGELLWKYADPVNSLGPLQGELDTVYQSVVPLANGNILLCGRRNFPKSTSNLVLILDRNGKLVEQREQREERPEIVKPLMRSVFRECISWQGGALLIGGAGFEGDDDRNWIVHLDGNGKKVAEFFFLNSEIFSQLGKQPIKSSDSIFVEMIPDSNRNNFFYQVSSTGKVIATRPLKDDPKNPLDPRITRLRSVDVSGTSRILVMQLEGKSTLYALNNRLEDVVPPRQVNRFDTTEGVGYALSDGSLGLFGREGNAAVAWIASNGERVATRIFDKRYNSYTINDVVAISANEFVTVRNGVTNDPNGGGVVLDWVTFQSDKKYFP